MFIIVDVLKSNLGTKESLSESRYIIEFRSTMFWLNWCMLHSATENRSVPAPLFAHCAGSRLAPAKMLWKLNERRKVAIAMNANMSMNERSTS